MMFKILFSVILGALVASLAWNRMLRRQLEDHDPAPVATTNSPPSNVPETSAPAPTLAAPRPIVDYAAEKVALDNLTREYRVAYNRGLPGNESVTEIDSRIARRRTDLNDAKVRLQANLNQESALGQEARSDVTAERTVVRTEQAELTARIHEQEAQIHLTQQQLKDANRAKFDFAAHERIAPLNQQLTEQRVMLQRFKEQRPQSSARGQNTQAEPQEQLRRRKESLHENREALRSTVREIQNDLTDLQKQSMTARSQLSAGHKELDDLKARLDAQRARVQAIRSGSPLPVASPTPSVTPSPTS